MEPFVLEEAATAVQGAVLLGRDYSQPGKAVDTTSLLVCISSQRSPLLPDRAASILCAFGDY